MHQAQLFVSFQVFFLALVVSDLCGVKVASYLCLAPCPYLDLMEGEHVACGVVDVHGQLGVDKHRVLEDSLVVDVDSPGMQAVDSEHSVHKDLVVWKDHIQDSLDRLAVDRLQEDILVVLVEPHVLEVSVQVQVDKLVELHVLGAVGGRLEVLAGFDADRLELLQEGNLVVLAVGNGRSTDGSSHNALVHMDLVLVQLVLGQQVALLELFVGQLGVQAGPLGVAVDKQQHTLHKDQLEPVEQLDQLVEDTHRQHFLDHIPLGMLEQPVGSLDSWVEGMTSLLSSPKISPARLSRVNQAKATFSQGVSPLLQPLPRRVLPCCLLE